MPRLHQVTKALYQSEGRKLDPVLRELGQSRTGWAAGSQFVFSQHCKSLRGLGALRTEWDDVDERVVEVRVDGAEDALLRISAQDA